MEEGKGEQNQKKVESAEDDEQMKSDYAAEAMDSYGYGGDGDGQWALLRFDVLPQRVYHFFQQFRYPHKSTSSAAATTMNPNPNPNNTNNIKNNFLKGVKWSPDGSSFLTSSDDNTLRLFSL